MTRRLVKRRLLAFMTATTVLAVACGGVTSPSLSDPKEIVTKAMEALAAAKSVHLQADVAGKVNIDLLGTGQASALDLQGTTVGGDVDITGKKVKVNLAAPALLGLSADAVVIGPDTWLKFSLLGPRWQHSTTPAKAEGAVSDPAKTIADLTAALAKLPTPPVKLPDERCGNTDCYHVQLKGTAADLGPLASAAYGISGDATVDMFIEHGTKRPVKLVVTTTAGNAGPLAVTLNLSNWDQAVTIEPPPASEVDEASPSL